MILDLSPAQRSFQHSVEQFTATRVAPAAADIETSAAIPPGLFADAAHAGLLAPLLGSGDAHVRLFLALEALAGGSAAFAAAVAAQAVVAEACRLAGGEGVRWAEALATARRFGAVSLDEGHDRVAVDGNRARGEVLLMAGPPGADLFLLAGTSASGASAVLLAASEATTKRSAGELAGFRGLELSRLTLADATGAALDPLAGMILRLAMAALAVGVGTAALREALALVKRTPGVSEQSVQSVLADSATELEAARLLGWKAAAAFDVGDADATTAVAMAKLAAGRAAQGAADRAFDVAGLDAFRRGALFERLVRDARATDILLGGTAVQRATVAEGTLPRV